ncbi:glucan endo-1,3-beta-glucosidase [Cocos nucifera]|nr:glucan endo-1,3-beta-glucosidase [Cocos nucifera]
MGGTIGIRKKTRPIVTMGMIVNPEWDESIPCETGAQVVGVNYGLLGDNLPGPIEVVDLLKSRNINLVRLFDPNHPVLSALQNSGISVVVGTRNDDIPKLASDPAFANTWVQANVVPFVSVSTSFRYITVGNEVIPGDLAGFVLPAMQNLDAALTAANLHIPVSTVVHNIILGVSFPPSQSAFNDQSSEIMAGIAGFLKSKNTPLLVNIYPYYGYAADPENVRLDYALFTASDAVVVDGSLSYYNLFDATLDGIYAALEKAGYPDLGVVVAETGWPSGGGPDWATGDNSATYNNNAVKHVTSGAGTPRRPGTTIETFIFGLFNENLKPDGIEQNWGLYYPDMTEVYHVEFP